MGVKPRISRSELEKLVSEGKGVSQIARELQASKSSISERCKRTWFSPSQGLRGLQGGGSPRWEWG